MDCNRRSTARTIKCGNKTAEVRSSKDDTCQRSQSGACQECYKGALVRDVSEWVGLGMKLVCALIQLDVY